MRFLLLPVARPYVSLYYIYVYVLWPASQTCYNYWTTCYNYWTMAAVLCYSFTVQQYSKLFISLFLSVLILWLAFFFKRSAVAFMVIKTPFQHLQTFYCRIESDVKRNPLTCQRFISALSIWPKLDNHLQLKGTSLLLQVGPSSFMLHHMSSYCYFM